MSVRQLLESVTSAELAEWMAFDRIEPFGDPREDLRAGILAATFVNHSMSPPKKAARPIDYMPFAGGKSGPIQIADPVKHGEFLAHSLFGSKVKKRHGAR